MSPVFSSFQSFLFAHKKKALFLFLLPHFWFNRKTETHILTPPLLDPDRNIQGYIPCFRPSRDETLRLEKEELGMLTDEGEKKFIFHAYGFGGSGFSTGPGSVKYMLEELFDPEIAQQKLNNNKKKEPIAIIGAGVIGSFTALGLLERGFTNITVFAESDEDLTSHKAAGIVSLFATSSSKDEDRQRLEKAAVDTFKFYTQKVMREGGSEEIADDRVGDARAPPPLTRTPNKISLSPPPSDAARRLPKYTKHAHAGGCDTDVFVRTGLMQPSRQVWLQFRRNLNESEQLHRQDRLGSSYVTNIVASYLVKTIYGGDYQNLTRPVRAVVYPDALFVDVQKIMKWLHHTIFDESNVKKVSERMDRERDILPLYNNNNNHDNNNNNNNNDHNNNHSNSNKKFNKELEQSRLKDFRYIFNCSGSGSRELFDDKKMHRNGGHLVELCNQGADRRTTDELNYVIDFDATGEKEFVDLEIPSGTETKGGQEENKGKTRKCEQYLYYVPKGDGGVLGGTMVHDMDEGEPFNPTEFERILQDAKKLFYGC